MQNKSEELIQKLFHSRFGVQLIKIDEKSGRNGKTPDFYCAVENKIIFVCELKEISKRNPFKDPDWQKKRVSDNLIIATRESNAVNQISKIINKAYLQLSKYNDPKVLIILNNNTFLDETNFTEVYRGYRIVQSGEQGLIDINAWEKSCKFIKKIKAQIDLYIWINPQEITQGGEELFKFFYTNETGKQIVSNYFSFLR